MGKYMRKTKNTGQVAVMEVSQSSLGVLTRARTLALRRLEQSSSPASSGSYLQLRSRRLQKPPTVFSGQDSKKHKQSLKEGFPRSPRSNPNSTRLSLASMASMPSMPDRTVSLGCVDDEGGQTPEKSLGMTEDVHPSENRNENLDLPVEEASFGENVLDFESRERSTRESTPCSLIRNPDIIRTPGSTTRPTSTTETNHRIRYPSNQHIPTAREMDEFFALAEEKQQRRFIEKYNFDPVKDTPLPGRYEWEKLQP